MKTKLFKKIDYSLMNLILYFRNLDFYNEETLSYIRENMELRIELIGEKFNIDLSNYFIYYEKRIIKKNEYWYLEPTPELPELMYDIRIFCNLPNLFAGYLARNICDLYELTL